jgi:acetyl-CoA acetyltransferase
LTIDNDNDNNDIDTDSSGREYDFPELRESLSRLGVSMQQLGEMSAEEANALIAVRYAHTDIYIYR